MWWAENQMATKTCPVYNKLSKLDTDYIHNEVIHDWSCR